MLTEEILARSVQLVREHFDAINRGDAAEVQAQLFQPPGMSSRPLEVYVTELLGLRPFVLERAELVATEEPKETERGRLGRVRVAITVSSPVIGTRSEVVPVWWFPDTDEVRIAVRFSNWLVAPRPA